VGAPQVNYRESISRPNDIRYTHKKQSGGSGQFADVAIRFEPGEPGSGFVFRSEIKGGAVPKEYIPGMSTVTVVILFVTFNYRVNYCCAVICSCLCFLSRSTFLVRKLWKLGLCPCYRPLLLYCCLWPSRLWFCFRICCACAGHTRRACCSMNISSAGHISVAS
jgi:hypothetical protein